MSKAIGYEASERNYRRANKHINKNTVVGRSTMISKGKDIARILAELSPGEGYKFYDRVAKEILSKIFADNQIPELLSRKEAKEKMCGGCTGTRMSGSYFSYECKDDAPKCQRLTDFIYGVEVQASKMIEDGWRKVRK